MKTNPKLIVLAIFLILIAFCLFSCKAVEKYKASPQFPADCADKFPIDTNTVYIPGKIIRDTVKGVTINCDSILAAQAAYLRKRALILASDTPHDTIYLEKPDTSPKCPDCENETKTDTIRYTVENTARVEAERREKEQYKAEAAKQKDRADRNGKQRNQSLIANGIFLLLLIAGIILRIKRRI